VMQATGPIDGDVGCLLVQLDSRRNGTSSRQLAEFVEAVKDGTVLSDIETLHLFVVLAHVVWSNGPEETDVVIRMELGHFLLSCFVWSINLHLSVESIVEEKVVGHTNTVRLHGVTLPIVVVAYVTYKKKWIVAMFHNLIIKVKCPKILIFFEKCHNGPNFDIYKSKNVIYVQIMEKFDPVWTPITPTVD
jgi:hypothetical protein